MVQSASSMKQSSNDSSIQDAMAKLLQEEIDWEIMADMMVRADWIMIDLPRFKDRYEAIDVELWIDENCKGKHMHRGKTYVFERKQDAEWFTLRWL